jgi:hypothetical protein
VSLPVPRPAALSLLLFAAACADRPLPLAPEGAPGRPAGTAAAAPAAPNDDERGRHERLARRLALALHDAGFRKDFFRTLGASRVREGKVHLQRFLAGNGGERRRLAALASEPEGEVARDLDGAAPIEVYLPVPAHRLRWKGDDNVLVATAEADRDIPVAFDGQGRRLLLDPDRPPATPVIALGRAELDFDAAAPVPASCATCDEDPDGGGASASGSPASGGGSATLLTSPGLYMTYAKFTQTFEGWLKGDPEFEVHVLGQDGSSTALKSYQCAGEKAGGPYQYDQNDKEWSGEVMLFSQAQLDAYRAAHPDQNLRILVLEDDDGACVIKMDSTRVARMFQQLVAAYGTLTGGTDTQLFSVKTFTKAVSLLNLFKSAWSVITTQDDLVGDAIQDSVAREFWPGANWIVKGENNLTNGALRLEMR